MYLLGFFVLVAGGILAVMACRPQDGRRIALVMTGLTTTSYLVVALLAWLGGSFDHELVQMGLLLAYGLIYGLVGAGIVRGLVRDSYAPLLACGIAAMMPVMGWVLFHLVGDPRNPVSGGIGHLSDLLFLNPIEMGEGVRRDGFIPHKYRVHHLALGVALLLAVALQFLPARARMSRLSVAAGQIGNSTT